MIRSGFHFWNLLALFAFYINWSFGQICEHGISDFFYNVDYAGPFFDQPVYTIFNLSVSTPKGTALFTFTVDMQNNVTRPSYFQITTSSVRLLKLSSGISVTSSDPNFRVEQINSDTLYTLFTNTASLNYFLPFHRHQFELIATQPFADTRRPPLRSTAIVEINLQNNNTHAPRFLSENELFYISEAALPDTGFGTIYAVDDDGDSITYTTNSYQFLVHPETGVLALRREFDLSGGDRGNYYANIVATDDKSSCASPLACESKSNSINITIIVISANRHSPEFLRPVYNTTIKWYENSNNITIASLLVSDLDYGNNGLINITFPSEELRVTANDLRNTPYSWFRIEQGIQTGTTREANITTIGTFDYEELVTIREWYLTIIARDNGIPSRQTFRTIRIELADINDNPPKFSIPFWNHTIHRSSNNLNNRRLFQIYALDADSGRNKEIDYYIRTISTRYFQIERKTGWITLRADVANLTILNKTFFPIIFDVYAQDRGLPPLLSSNNATIHIHLTDVDNPSSLPQWIHPILDNETINITISEKFSQKYPNTPLFDNISTNVFNGSFIYRLQSPMSPLMTVSSLFSNDIDPSFSQSQLRSIGNNVFTSGIELKGNLNAAIQNEYLLRLYIHGNPPLVRLVNIKIQDENDQIPTFDIRSIRLSVQANEGGTRTIAQVQAFDRDIDGDNKYIEYFYNTNLTDSDTRTKFHVESNGLIRTNETFGSGQDTKRFYRLFITACNTKKPAWNSDRYLSQDFQIDVEVIHNDNNIPNLIASQSNISIDETTKNRSILNVTIIDLDMETNMNLGILSGNDRNAFAFILLLNNSNNSTRERYEAIGELKVVGLLDYTLKSIYSLTLFAFDGKNLAALNVTVNLVKKNTRAPRFHLMPGFSYYEFNVSETISDPTYSGPKIKAVDDNFNDLPLNYTIYDNRHQLNLMNLLRDNSTGYLTIRLNSPGLSYDLPFGRPTYIFAIKATDQANVSSYAPVRITLQGRNNKAPIPMIDRCISEGVNPSIPITFYDYDNSTGNANSPYTVGIVKPPNIGVYPMSGSGAMNLTYYGSLNRTSTKSFTVTFNASDIEGNFQITTVSIIVCDQLQPYPISNGTKNIQVLYINGYESSLSNVDLGSVFVEDLNDWYQSSRSYSIISQDNEGPFSVSQGWLRSERLNRGLYKIGVSVTKPNVQSSAIGTINLLVDTVDGDIVRQATTIRIQGEYPETLIDRTLGYPIRRLRSAIAAVLKVTIDCISILCIRSVYQYQIPYQPPKPLDVLKNTTLTDIIFHVSTLSRLAVCKSLRSNRERLRMESSIEVISIEPNPCDNYVCPDETHCRATRTVLPKPYVIDTNHTSFVGINILESADCINAAYRDDLKNSSISCPSRSASLYDLDRQQSIKTELTFDENSCRCTIYKAEAFSSFAPTRFSFDFLLRSIQNGLILFYGRNNAPIDHFPWLAVDISENQLRFHYRSQPFVADKTILKNSIWYHVECQFLHSEILLSINDCQYIFYINDTSNEYDSSNVYLYLGGVPMNQTINYPSLNLPLNNTFYGCIRNVLSNGCYLDVSSYIGSASCKIEPCPCEGTNTCIPARFSDLVPWYTWLIIALVLLLLAIIIILTLLTCFKKRHALKLLAELYIDDTRDNILDYKESAGEQDQPAYNLKVLKKPIYFLSNNDTITDNDQIGYSNPSYYYRPALGDYIDEKLNEQVLSYANDTQLHYLYEGDGSINSDLSSIQPSSSANINQHEYLQSLGPKFAQLVDLYDENTNEDDIVL